MFIILPDIKRKIWYDYGPEDTPSIISKLEEFMSEFQRVYREESSPRIIRCVLHLAAGDEEKLSHYIHAALDDWRDVIYWAEYQGGEKRVWSGSRKFVS